MGVSGYDHIDSGCDRIDPQRLQVMYDENGSRGEPNELGISIVVGPIALVDVSPYRRDRRYSPELRDDVRATDVAAMDNVIRAREKSHRLRPQETVCIGEDADPECHRVSRRGPMSEKYGNTSAGLATQC